MPKYKILVLMKRFGSNRDMVKDNFGREIRLFEQLNKKYDIDFVCPDYHCRENFRIKKIGINFFVVPASFFNPFSMLDAIGRIVRKKNYDVIIPTTEPLLGIIGYYFARKYRIPIIYEVQDNYEMYYSYKLPMVRFLDHMVIRKADYVFYSNYPLMKKLGFLRRNNVEVIENGVDLDFFRIMPKKTARNSLNIELNRKIIAYTGSISKDRGLDYVIKAVEQLRDEGNDLYMLLSGKVSDGINIKKPWIIYKELRKRKQVVEALNASDVLIIASTDNPFTRYSFPQKLFEYMSVNVPIVATAVGDVARILKRFKGTLSKPGSIDDIKYRIISQMKRKSINYRKMAADYTWEKLSKRLDRMIEKVIK